MIPEDPISIEFVDGTTREALVLSRNKQKKKKLSGPVFFRYTKLRVNIAYKQTGIQTGRIDNLLSSLAVGRKRRKRFPIPFSVVFRAASFPAGFSRAVRFMSPNTRKLYGRTNVLSVKSDKAPREIRSPSRRLVPKTYIAFRPVFTSAVFAHARHPLAPSPPRTPPGSV